MEDDIKHKVRNELQQRKEDLAKFCNLRLEESNKMNEIRTRTFLYSLKSEIAYCGVEMVANEIWFSRFKRIFSHFNEEKEEKGLTESRVNVDKIENLTARKSTNLVVVVRHPFSR